MSSLLLQLGRDDSLIVRPDRVHTLGREPSVSLHVPYRILSKRQLQLTFTDGDWWISEGESTGGNYVNHDRLTGPRKLALGDIVRAGNVDITVAGRGTCLADIDEPWPADQVVALARSIATDLMSRHARSLACGALSPTSVLVCDDGSARVGGLFATAGNVDLDPRYVAPELAGSSQATPAADVYSVGRILGELLPAVLPPALLELIAGMLAPDPRNRLASAVDLFDELRAPRLLAPALTDSVERASDDAPAPQLPVPDERDPAPEHGYWVTIEDQYDYDRTSYGPFPSLALAFEYCDAYNGAQLKGDHVPEAIDMPRSIGVWNKAWARDYDFDGRMLHYLRHRAALPTRTADEIEAAYGIVSDYEWRKRKLDRVEVRTCWCAALLAGNVPDPPREQLAAWRERYLKGDGGGSIGSTSAHHGDLYRARCTLCQQPYLHLMVELEGYGNAIHHYYAPARPGEGVVDESWFEGRPGIHVEGGRPTVYRRATVGHLGFDHSLET